MRRHRSTCDDMKETYLPCAETHLRKPMCGGTCGHPSMCGDTCGGSGTPQLEPTSDWITIDQSGDDLRDSL